jgi:hypothetical protein
MADYLQKWYMAIFMGSRPNTHIGMSAHGSCSDRLFCVVWGGLVAARVDAP